MSEHGELLPRKVDWLEEIYSRRLNTGAKAAMRWAQKKLGTAFHHVRQFLLNPQKLPLP